MLYLGMLIGVIFVLGGKLNKIYFASDFTWKQFFHLNWIATALNLLAGIVLIAGRADYMVYLGNVKFGFIFAVLVGMGAQLALQTAFDFASNRVKTKLGINKPDEPTP